MPLGTEVIAVVVYMPPIFGNYSSILAKLLAECSSNIKLLDLRGHIFQQSIGVKHVKITLGKSVTA